MVPSQGTDASRARLKGMFHAMQHHQHNNSQTDPSEPGLNRDQVFEAFASHADTSFDDPSQLRQVSRKGRRKSLLSAFESKLSKKASKAANESNLTLPVVSTRSSSIVHSPSSSSSSSVPKSSLRRHASSGSNSQKHHAEYYQPALRPIGSHSHRDRQASIDSDISKVSTFDLDLFSIDDPKPSQKKSSSKAGRRLSAIDTGDSKVSLRPKAKSLRDVRRSENNSNNNNSSSSWQPPADEIEMKSSLSSSHRTPRSRSRVLRSPPPPPPTDHGMEQLPSMPNVDVKQIKVELETPRSTTATGTTATHPDTAEASTKSRRTDQHLTANVLSNVKRRLSLGKDRNRAGKDAAANPSTSTSTSTSTSAGRQSLPATFLKKARSSSRTHSLAVDRRKSPTLGAESPPPPLPVAGHFGSTARRRHQSVEQYEADAPEIIPPVPPVPKHHSIAKKDSSCHLEVHHGQSRASSASSGPPAVSGDEHQPQQKQQQQLQQRSSRRSLRRKTSRHSSFGDVDDSEVEDTKTKKSSERRMSRPESVKESLTSLWRKRSISKTSKSKDKIENALPAQAAAPLSTAQTSTVRKRGKTLPGSLAAPPPVPAMPLPPMKVEPITVLIPDGGSLPFITFAFGRRHACRLYKQRRGDRGG
ncbi:hypothetical protein BCR43DRAFT_30790 [Syncephalastrum racemosum]|uniref:Uncharacterized protein n=1 Tax=Syncephalastrum racemosum TaxID=13706 RepID=A0A1X2HTU8_SYNRA|nr:hypothetical protein BCR43DRAFT_30790 [Syncephalastrum racemosum]